MTETNKARALYFWLFTFVGVLAPFFGPYLKSLGLTGTEVGVLGATLPIAAAVVPPIWGAVADRMGETTRPLQVALVGATIALLPFPALHTFTPLLLVLGVFAVFRTGSGPLLDSLTFTMLERTGGDYGRVRLYGSLGFLVASAAVALLTEIGADLAIALGLVATQALAGISSLTLPRVPRDRSVDLLGDLGKLVRVRAFRLFLLAVFLNRLASSGPLYFYPVFMREAGLSNAAIAAFWFAGVSAEVLLFQYARAIVARIHLGTLYLVATLAIVLRYAALLVVAHPALVIAVQVLHALTFGAFYYASVTYVARAVPLRLRASGQALFTAVGLGIGGGIASLLGGVLYDAFHIDGVLWCSIALGLVATLAALPVVRDMSRWRAPGAVTADVR